jgi:hypothetical protein
MVLNRDIGSWLYVSFPCPLLSHTKVCFCLRCAYFSAYEHTNTSCYTSGVSRSIMKYVTYISLYTECYALTNLKWKSLELSCLTTILYNGII